MQPCISNTPLLLKMASPPSLKTASPPLLNVTVPAALTAALLSVALKAAWPPCRKIASPPPAKVALPPALKKACLSPRYCFMYAVRYQVLPCMSLDISLVLCSIKGWFCLLSSSIHDLWALPLVLSKTTSPPPSNMALPLPSNSASPRVSKFASPPVWLKISSSPVARYHKPTTCRCTHSCTHAR